MSSSWETLKILSDSTRLRLLALLLKEELSVAELQEILGMAQSRISSQLALLRQAGFVSDRREGKKAFYSLRAGLPPRQLSLLKAACESVSDLPESAEDRDNLDRSLQKRRRVSEQYFNLIAGRLGRNHCPGRSWEAIGHLALRLVPAITVADLGAGEGLISQLIAHRAERVWCIDNSVKMVEVGTELAKKNGLANLTYKLGDIERVPLPDKSVDLAILSQALHHASHPQTAVNEAFRILKPGGQLLVLDLKEHTFEKAPELYGDLWLGFKESALHGFLKKAGFQKVEVEIVSREENEPHFETIARDRIKEREIISPYHRLLSVARPPAQIALFNSLLIALLTGCIQPVQTTRVLKPATWDALEALPVPPADRILAYGAAPQQPWKSACRSPHGLHPVVLLLHGGCWQNSFDRAYLSHLAEALRVQGWATFNVEYRRLGDAGGGWPGTFHDVAAATTFVLAHATDWQLDPVHVVVIGHSAGGQLALLLASREPRITAVVGLAAITDLAAYRKEPDDCGASAGQLVGEANLPEADPMQQPLPPRARIFLWSGSADGIVPAAYGTRYAARSGAITHIIWPGAGHFDLVSPLSVVWPEILREISQLR